MSRDSMGGASAPPEHPQGRHVWRTCIYVRTHPPVWAADDFDARRARNVRGPEDVARFLSRWMPGLPSEVFLSIPLDTQHRPLGWEVVTRGTLDSSLVHPREVFRAAIVDNASGVILAHNHPSGDPTPSIEDRAVTRQMARAGKAVGIPVLDHVVIGEGGRWVSLAALGALDL